MSGRLIRFMALDAVNRNYDSPVVHQGYKLDWMYVNLASWQALMAMTPAGTTSAPGTMAARIAACIFSFGCLSASAAKPVKPAIALWQTKNEEPRLTIFASWFRYGFPLPALASRNSSRISFGAFLTVGRRMSFHNVL